MLTVILVGVLIFVYAFFIYYSKKDYREKLSKFKSEPSLPFIGHSHRLGKTQEDLLPMIEKMWIKFGRDKFLLKLGVVDHIVITNPKDVEALLITHRSLHKNVLYKHIAGIVGDGILTVEPNKWHTMRKILTPAFYNRVLESHESIYQEQSEVLLKELSKVDNADLNFLDVFFRIVLVAVTKAVIGLDLNLENDKKYSDFLTELVAITNDKVFSPWKSINFLYNLTPEGKMFNKKLQWVYEKNLKVLIEKRGKISHLIEDIKSGKSTFESITNEENFEKKHLGFLDLLLLAKNNNGEPLTNEAITAEILTFTLAGIETTAVANAFAVYNLATNPEIQEKALEEQKLITNNDLSKPVTVKEIKEMSYLTAIIKESMRLDNPVIFYGREIVQDVTLPDGTILPAGANVLFFPYFAQRHPDIFPNACKFDPERFINNNPAPFTYYPFSVGVRDCIGKRIAMIQLKFYLATLIRNYELLPPTGPAPKATVELALKSSTGVCARYKKRQTC